MLVVVEPLSLFLAYEGARLLICRIAGLQKGTSDKKQGFAATAHYHRADPFGRSISPVKQC